MNNLHSIQDLIRLGKPLKEVMMKKGRIFRGLCLLIVTGTLIFNMTCRDPLLPVWLGILNIFALLVLSGWLMEFILDKK